jgi:Tfp pilus assembly protein PilX
MEKNISAESGYAYSRKTKKASTLVFALIILSIVLVSAISVAAITATERRSSIATDKSAESFQVADSGAEIVLNQIYKGSNTDIGSLVSSLQTALPADNIACNISDGSIGGRISSGKTFAVNLYKSDGTVESCSSSDSVSNIVNIKSTGSYAQTSRAVNVSVSVPSSSACSPLSTSNAIVLYDFEENLGYAVDKSGNGNDGQVDRTGGVAALIYNYGVCSSKELEGGYIYLNNDLGSLPNQGTIEFWMTSYNNTGAGSHPNLVSTNYTGGNDAIRFEEDFDNNSFGVNVEGNSSTIIPAGQLPDNTWYFVAYTWNKSANTESAYYARFDDSDIKSAFENQAQSSWPSGIPKLGLGLGYSTDSQYRWAGTIDDFLLANKAYSKSEISQQFQNAKGLIQTGHS